MSYYSNDPKDEEWTKPLKEWDHNQLMALVEAYVMLSHDPKDFQEKMEQSCLVSEAASAVWNTGLVDECALSSGIHAVEETQVPEGWKEIDV
jgi:hypothetical protein